MFQAGGDFRLALITGAAKSGKSRYAQTLAESHPGPRLFMATAEPLDQEMAVRIARHQELRGPEWVTREEPLALAPALQDADNHYEVILVDCLTIWLSNLLVRRPPGRQTEGVEITLFLETLKTLKTPVILVTNEVGWGIVPDNPLAREFRDLAGDLHQRLARLADLVVLVVCGLPLPLKPGFHNLLQ